MSMIIIIGITILFGVAALSSTTQAKPQQPQVIYIRAEQLDSARVGNSGGGMGLFFFFLVVAAALALL